MEKLKLFLVAALACCLAACNGGNGSASAKVVKLGVFQPMTGDNAPGGRQEVLGVEYAHSLTPTVDIGGTTYTVELVYADNKSSVEEAPLATQRLVDAGVSMVLGSYGSSVCIAAHSVLGPARMPTLGISCTNPAVTAGNDFYFRICYLDSYQCAVLANFAQYKFGAEKAYVLAKRGDAYSEGLCEYFMEDFGIDKCVYESYQEGETDFSAFVANAAAAGAEVFFSPIAVEAGALLIGEIIKQNLSIPILAGDTWDSNIILNAAKNTDIQIYITTYYHEGGNTRFDSGYKAWLSNNPDKLASNGGDNEIAAVAAMGYDAYYVALEALKAAGSTDREKILSVLGGVSYEGITGAIEFEPINGDAIRNLAYIIRANTQTVSWEFVAQQGTK